MSEKWFYSYFKNNTEKLPRIDILNLLSVYVGYDNWEAFKNTHSNTKTPSKKGSVIKIVGLLIAILLLVFVFKIGSKKPISFLFCR